MRLAACLAVGIVVLSGCSEKQEASNTLPTASASATATTPELPPFGPEEFPVPPKARQKTPEGAVEFVRYYMALAEVVAEQGVDPQAILDVSQDCLTCVQIAQAFIADRKAGYTYRDYSFTFDEYGPASLDGDMAEMGFVYEQSAVTVEDASGRVVADRSTDPSGKLQSGAHLTWRDDIKTWVITSLTVG
jgi:hypothetical protein